MMVKGVLGLVLSFIVFFGSWVYPAYADDEKELDPLSKINSSIYEKVAPTVVGVTYGVSSRGTGVVISKDGLIATHILAVGLYSTDVYVFRKGHVKVRANVICSSADKDLVILKIDKNDLPAIEIGNSDDVAIGQSIYVLGDTYNSIFADDEPAMTTGIVSGIYEIKEHQVPDVSYKGKVIEIGAIANFNEAGAPLVDEKGKLIGIVTLDYDKSRSCGLAIPINELKPLIEEASAKLKKGKDSKERR